MAIPKKQELVEAKRVVVLLTKARALLNKGWCQFTDAKNKEGAEVNFDSRTAVRFCAEGAIYRVTTPKNRRMTNEVCRVQHQVQEFVKQAAGEENISVWNDNDRRMKGDIIRGFTNGITLAKEAVQKLLHPQPKKVVAAKKM